MDGKPWYLSKTLWVNAISLVAMGVQMFTGTEIVDAEAQFALLGVVNLVLRLVTGQKLQIAG
jgi:hypothetical protein